MAIKLYSGLTPAGDYPLIEAKDVEMPDGTRLSEFKGGSGVPEDFFVDTDGRILVNEEYLPEIGAAAEIPVFDLAAMGLPAVPLDGGSVQVSTDATALFEALNRGAVTFAIPCNMGGMAMTGYCTAFSFTDGVSMHQCIGAVYLAGFCYVIMNIYTDMISITASPFNSLVDEYIGNALGGDY